MATFTDDQGAMEISNMKINGVENNGYTAADDVSQNGTMKETISEKALEAGGTVGLNRTMGYRQGVALMVGLILGSGIFLSPGLIAKHSNSHGMIIAIWLSAGCLAMMGSLCYCELASIFKLAGSNYVNVQKIYGNVPGFLCAWTTCLVIDPSSIAAIGMTIGLYLAKPFYATDEDAQSMQKILAACVILIAYTINCISVKCSSRVQSVFVVAQVSSVFFVIVLGMWQLGKGHTENFHDMFNTTTGNGTEDSGSVIHVGLALFSALWSYDGWSQMSNAVEEMKNVERNLILTISTAFPFVILCYTLVNVSLLSRLNRKQMGASEAVGVEFVKAALGMKAAYAMMTIVGLSAYGTLNGTLFACPRLTLAAARKGHMPSFFALINKKTLSPIPATTLTATLALLMLAPSANDLSVLILLFSQAQWILYSASFLGVIVMRIRKPDLERPFKVFIGIPILVFIVSATLVIIPFFEKPKLSCGLFGFIILGIPVYFLFVHFKPRFPTECVNSLTQLLEKHCGMVPCRPEHCS